MSPSHRVERFWALGTLALVACGSSSRPPHALEGSLSTLMDLRYDSSVIDLTADELAVRFVRAQGEGEDIVFKVTVRLIDLALVAGEEVNLAEQTSAGSQRGVMSRNVLDDPRRTFPALARGRLLLNRDVIAGEKVPGDFSATFENGTELASGRTVFGNFEAIVQ